jgi:preprotein translocase subunit SecE
MKLINYIKETKAEMKHVSWPTKRQAITYTILVVIVSALTAAYLGAFDWIFEGIIKKTF